jgi:glycine/D-amino acid oxidase-like deaminating enzyme
MRVVICGGGVIGACTAYFLARRGIDIIVVERTEVAAAASGKAGGFLALTGAPALRSRAGAARFGLHATAWRINGDWGTSATYGGFVVPDRDARRRVPSELDWLSDGVLIAQRLGTTGTTAMLHPRKFTAAMMSAAQQHGAELRDGRVTGLRRAESTVTGVEIDGGVIEADAVVVALGPWSLLAAAWMDLPPVFGRRSPSVTTWAR